MLFEKIVEIVKNSSTDVEACSHIDDAMIEEIYQAGIYHGLFHKQNFGFHDRRNSVYCFIGTMIKLKEEKIEVA